MTLPKLRLDDAIAQGHMQGWSSARIRYLTEQILEKIRSHSMYEPHFLIQTVEYSAWSLREQNPNAYYYRFNEPGEKQRNGKWTEAEKKLFFDRMKEVTFRFMNLTLNIEFRTFHFISSNESIELKLRPFIQHR